MNMKPASDCENDPKDSECFITSNDLLLKNILSHLPLEDLLACSLVSRRWHKHSRAELKKGRVEFLARIVPGKKDPCEQLQELSSFLNSLPEGSIVPYNGLSIDYCYHPQDDCGQDSSLVAELYSGVVTRCPLRSFRVTLNHYTDCSSMKLIKLLINERGEEIESLAVSNYQEYFFEELPDFLGIEDPSNWLPNLKTLEMSSEIVETVLNELVAGAPKLERIKGFVGPYHLPDLLEERKAGLITGFRLEPESGDVDSCLELARLKPRLESLFLSSHLLRSPAGSQKYLEILALLLESSAETLEELDVSHLDLILLSTLDIPPLKRLKKLSINYHQMLDKRLNYFSLQRIHFLALCPALTSLRIYAEVSRAHILSMSADLQGVLDTVSKRESYSFSSIRSLELSGLLLNSVLAGPITAITDAFPRVASVHLCKSPDLSSNLRFLLGSSWPLESLSFQTEENPKSVTNLDSIFCGISSEEVASLQGRDGKALEGFNFSPDHNSLLNFTHLKSLKIEVKHQKHCPPIKPTGANFLSTVTASLVLSKMPELKVEIRRKPCWDEPGPGSEQECCFQCNDIREFVTVIEGLDDNIHTSDDEEGSSHDSDADELF